MMFDIHPALPMILGGIVLPLLPLSIRRVMLPIIPLIGLWNVYGIPHGQDETIYLAEFVGVKPLTVKKRYSSHYISMQP